eukprot:6438880-Prymnesium_polylepis.1
MIRHAADLRAAALCASGRRRRPSVHGGVAMIPGDPRCTDVATLPGAVAGWKWNACPGSSA